MEKSRKGANLMSLTAYAIAEYLHRTRTPEPESFRVHTQMGFAAEGGYEEEEREMSYE